MKFFSENYAALAVIIILFFVAGAHASSLRAFVDKKEIKVGDAITLTLEYLGRTEEEPDFSVLKKDFEIDFLRKSSESSVVNGDFAAKTSWILQIYPKTQAMSIRIPAIKLNNSSSMPIGIIQSETSSSKNIDGLMLNVFTDRDTVYQNAQLILAFEIKTSLPLRNGTLTDPKIEHAIVEPLIEGDLTETIENGIRYHIFKRSYAVFPLKAGNLTIPPISFRGVMIDDRGSRPAWPSFFSRGKQISARSKEFTVVVKGIPPEYPKDQPFLPMKEFVVADSIDKHDQKFEINKAITRSFDIKALGTLGSFLPTLRTPSIKDLQIYAEDGNKINKNLKDGIESISQFSHVYIPTVPGKISVPEQIIYWWDTEADKLRTSAIRAFDFEVSGINPNINEPIDLGQEKTRGQALPSSSKDQPWPLILGIALLISLAMISIMMWKKYQSARSTRTPGKSKTDELRLLIKEIIALCDQGDAKRVYQHLRLIKAWAEKNQHMDVVNNDIDILIDHLAHALFDQGNFADKEMILQKIKQCFKSLKMTKKAPSKLLPLYPT
jgi:hypothetical protein